jgi:hypothetical protein
MTYAFRVGALPDIVESGWTGVMSELRATEDLAVQISALFGQPQKLLARRVSCRERAEW